MSTPQKNLDSTLRGDDSGEIIPNKGADVSLQVGTVKAEGED